MGLANTIAVAVFAVLVACATLHINSPVVANNDAANYSKPLEALQEARALFADPVALLSKQKLGEIFTTGDPLVAMLVASAGIMLFCWSGSVLTGDYSFVDRIWSLSPWLFVLYFAYRAPTMRAIVVAALTAAWGLR